MELKQRILDHLYNLSIPSYGEEACKDAIDIAKKYNGSISEFDCTLLTRMLDDNELIKEIEKTVIEDGSDDPRF
jgi:hypothetical protein